MKLLNVAPDHIRVSFPGRQGSYTIPHAEEDLTADDVPEFANPREAWDFFNPPAPPAPPPSEEEVLAAAKRQAADELRQWRESALSAGFEFAGNHFQTRHAADRINILGVGTAAQAAMATGQPFTVNFRATDNSVVPMDAATAAAFYATMIQQAQAIWDEYNARYEAITQAASVEDLEGIL